MACPDLSVLPDPLPAAYAAYVDDESHRESQVWRLFHAPDSIWPVDWSQDFPYTPEQPLRHCLPEEFERRLEQAQTESEESEVLDEVYRYLDRLQATITRGVVFLADEGCGYYTVLVVRGPAHGQVWHVQVSMDGAVATPRRHPVTSEPLDFEQWLRLQDAPMRLSVVPRRKLSSLLTFPLLSAEGKMAMRFHRAEGTLRGCDEADIAALKRKRDIPTQAEFQDPHDGQWHSLSDAIVYQWSEGLLS